MYFCNWFRNLCYSLYFLLSSAYLHDIMIEFKGNNHFSLYTVYAKLQWVNTFMSMKHIHVKVYIKYIKIGGGGGAIHFERSYPFQNWYTAWKEEEEKQIWQGMYFPFGGLCLPFLTFVHGDGVTAAGGVCGAPCCVLLLHRLALAPFVEQFCQSGGSWDRRFNRILHTWNSFSTHLPETLNFKIETFYLSKRIWSMYNKRKCKIKH